MTTATFYYNKQSERVFKIAWAEGDGWWNGDVFMAHVIAAVVDKLSKNCNGYPSTIFMEELAKRGLDVFNSNPNSDDFIEASSAANDRWTDILNKIKFSFSEVFENDDYDMKIFQDSEYKSRIDDGRLLFAQYFDSLWD